MRRAAFNLLAFLSLLVFLAAGGFWVRGQFAAHFVHFGDKRVETLCIGTRTGVRIFVDHDPSPNPMLQGSGVRIGQPMKFNSKSSFLHIEVEVSQSRELFAAHIPYWLVMLLSLPLPALWFVHRRRSAHRRRLGLCVKCGYDLCGSAGGAACPECGVSRA